MQGQVRSNPQHQGLQDCLGLPGRGGGGGGGRTWRLKEEEGGTGGGGAGPWGGEEEDLEGEEEDLPLPLIDGEGVKTMKRRFSFLALVEGSSQRGSGGGGGGPPNTPFHYFCQNEGQSVGQIPFIQICEQ